MKYVKGAGAFSNDDLSCLELISEIGDCLTVLRWHLDSVTPSVNRTRAFERVEEIEKHLIPVLCKKIGVALSQIPADAQEKNKL